MFFSRKRPEMPAAASGAGISVACQTAGAAA